MKQERFETILELARRQARSETVVPDGTGLAPEEAALPPGLATRVASQWARTAPDGEWVLWDRVTRWGLALAAVVCVASFLLRSEKVELPPTPFDQWVLGTEEGGRG